MSRSAGGGSAWKGLPVGVGRDVFECKTLGGLGPLAGPAAEKRDGSVPARTRRGAFAFSGVGVGSSSCGLKSGKPSVGDSGMFSRSGVECPLVGGPQGFAAMRSCA